MKTWPPRRRTILLLASALFWTAQFIHPLRGSENLPHAPFARWADVPARGQFALDVTAQESEAYHFWDAHRRHLVDYEHDGEHYGIDVTQGFIMMQYGLSDEWAADLSIGATSVGWRYFSNFGPSGASRDTTGLMDTALGVRYQICREDAHTPPWQPTLTFRAGGILPGTFDKDFPFAPGLRSAGVEPELLARKQFGWEGFGVYADGLFRWNATTANDQYIVAVGFFQKLGSWELDAGYRRLGTTEGGNIRFDPATRFIDYPRAVKENSHAVDAGFSYTTPRRRIRYGFLARTVVGGLNTDQKFWLGAYLDIPFGPK